MLGWALTFFIIAILAAIFGFGGIAAGAASTVLGRQVDPSSAQPIVDRALGEDFQ